MAVMLALARQADQEQVASLIHDYVCEMLTFIGADNLSADPLAAAIALLNAYWNTADHYPFLIYCDNELAGFALLRRYPADTKLFDMGQFFVSDRFKGKGVGREAFRQTLARFPGEWLIRALPDNIPAFEFWKKVIAEVTQGQFKISTELDKNTEMHFIRFPV